MLITAHSLLTQYLDMNNYRNYWTTKKKKVIKPSKNNNTFECRMLHELFNRLWIEYLYNSQVLRCLNNAFELSAMNFEDFSVDRAVIGESKVVNGKRVLFKLLSSPIHPPHPHINIQRRWKNNENTVYDLTVVNSPDHSCLRYRTTINYSLKMYVNIFVGFFDIFENND